MLMKDSNPPGRPGRIAYLIDIFCLIVGIGFSVGLVLMWAVTIGVLIYLFYLSMNGLDVRTLGSISG